MLEEREVRRNLMVLDDSSPDSIIFNILMISILKQRVDQGFVGCLRRFRLKDRALGKWAKNKGVIPCSDKVEKGFFLGPEGGMVQVAKNFRVGLDFDITLQIKPRNISGMILAIRGRSDFLVSARCNILC